MHYNFFFNCEVVEVTPTKKIYFPIIVSILLSIGLCFIILFDTYRINYSNFNLLFPLFPVCSKYVACDWCICGQNGNKIFTSARFLKHKYKAGSIKPKDVKDLCVVHSNLDSLYGQYNLKKPNDAGCKVWKDISDACKHYYLDGNLERMSILIEDIEKTETEKNRKKREEAEKAKSGRGATGGKGARGGAT